MPRRDWLQVWLHEWAQWEENISGYDGETTISRARTGVKPSGRVVPDLIRGIEPNAGWMRRLIKAMADCSARPADAKFITAMKLYYLIGPEKAEEILGRPARTLRRYRLRGEAVLRGELKSTGAA